MDVDCWNWVLNLKCIFNLYIIFTLLCKKILFHIRNVFRKIFIIFAWYLLLLSPLIHIFNLSIFFNIHLWIYTYRKIFNLHVHLFLILYLFSKKKVVKKLYLSIFEKKKKLFTQYEYYSTRFFIFMLLYIEAPKILQINTLHTRNFHLSHDNCKPNRLMLNKDKYLTKLGECSTVIRDQIKLCLFLRTHRLAILLTNYLSFKKVKFDWAGFENKIFCKAMSDDSIFLYTLKIL